MIVEEGKGERKDWEGLDYNFLSVFAYAKGWDNSRQLQTKAPNRRPRYF